MVQSRQNSKFSSKNSNFSVSKIEQRNNIKLQQEANYDYHFKNLEEQYVQRRKDEQINSKILEDNFILMYSSIEGGNQVTSTNKLKYKNSTFKIEEYSNNDFMSVSQSKIEETQEIILSQTKSQLEAYKKLEGNYDLILGLGIFVIFAGADGIVKLSTTNERRISVLNREVVCQNPGLSIGAIVDWKQENLIVAVNQSGTELYLYDYDLELKRTVRIEDNFKHDKNFNQSKIFLQIFDNIAVWNLEQDIIFFNLDTNEIIITKAFFNLEFS